MNEYLDFYTKNKISPVRQNIDDFENHIRRRAGLYRQLGLPPMLFSGKNVLEVGPGGGFNALATYTFEPSHYTLVEPNETGFEEIKANFQKFHFDRNVSFINATLESFKSDEHFEIILCEGLVQGLPDKVSFLQKLESLLSPGGLLVITVADEISMFFEIIRRHLSNRLTSKCNTFEEKIALMVEAFSPHLKTLEGMTRRYDDWCADLLCDAIYNHTFSLIRALEILGEECFLYGMSPNLTHDYRWYKALPQTPSEYNRYCIDQYNAQRHNLLDFRVETPERDPEANTRLLELCRKLILQTQILEKNETTTPDQGIISTLETISHSVSDLSGITQNAIASALHLCQSESLNAAEVASAKELAPAFGRGQTYLSFIRQ